MARRVPFLLLVGVLIACGGGKPSKKKAKAAKTEQVKLAEATPAAAAANAEENVLEYAYSPVGKRDPFRSPIDDAAERPSDAAETRPDCGPLCKWELEQLKLVAVISGISNPVAMVEAPGGKGFIVRRGSFIGKRNGKVTQIRSGEIVVTEIFKDQMGKPHINPVLIRIPADKNAVEPDELNLLGPEVAE